MANLPEPLRTEYVNKVWPRFGTLLERHDGAAQLVAQLPKSILPEEAAIFGDAQRTWELCGLYYFNLGRWHEALAVFQSLYDQMLLHQQEANIHAHKGMPLVWISDCYGNLGCPVLARRYLMLTTCEDAIRDKGHIQADQSGVYFRWVWKYGLGHGDLNRYAGTIWDLYQKNPDDAAFPEWILQDLDDHWMTGYPSSHEASLYVITASYVKRLLARLGSGDGMALERLAQ